MAVQRQRKAHDCMNQPLYWRGFGCSRAVPVFNGLLSVWMVVQRECRLLSGCGASVAALDDMILMLLRKKAGYTDGANRRSSRV